MDTNRVHDMTTSLSTYLAKMQGVAGTVHVLGSIIDGVAAGAAWCLAASDDAWPVHMNTPA